MPCREVVALIMYKVNHSGENLLAELQCLYRVSRISPFFINCHAESPQCNYAVKVDGVVYVYSAGREASISTWCLKKCSYF